jgi:uncharacterized coiled-coil protein SlyX
MSSCFLADRVILTHSDNANVIVVNEKKNRYDESTPEKMTWGQQVEPEGRPSRSKSRNKINPSSTAYSGADFSDRKRGMPAMQSVQGPVATAPAYSQPSQPKQVNKTSVIKRKAPSTSTRLFNNQGGRRSDNDVDYMGMHNKLINEILREEEEVLNQHKEHIDSMYRSSKVEAKMIEEVELPGSDIMSYIDGLDTVLSQHLTDISRLQDRLKGFKDKLQEEHRLNNICYELAQNNEQENGAEYPDTDPDFPEEPRTKAPKLQYNYDYPNPRNSNYKS